MLTTLNLPSWCSGADHHRHEPSEWVACVMRSRGTADLAGTGGAPRTHYTRDPLGWFMSMMIGPLHQLGKFKVVSIRTTPPFVPKGGQSRNQLLSEFVRLQADLVTLIRSADGLPLDAVKIVSPFGGRMKYSAYSALVIVARHEHRHIQQAEQAAS